MSSLGIFNSSNYRPEQAEGQSFAGEILRISPQGTAPLLGLTSRISKTFTNTPEYTWGIEGPLFAHSAVLVGADTCPRGTISQITVEHAGVYVEGDILQVNGTQEHLRVAAIDGERVLRVQRGYGTLPPQPIVPGVEVWRIGTAFEESSLRPQAHSLSAGQKLTNITQIFRNTWGVSGTVAATRLRELLGAAEPLAESRLQGMKDHAQNLEMSLLFGQMYEGVHKGQPIRKMDGLISLIRKHAPENIHQAPDVMTLDMLENMVDPCFNYVSDQTNPNDRILLVGAAGKKFITQLGRYSGQTWLQQGQTSFGHRFDSFITSRGTFHVLEHPLFNVNKEWQRMMLVLDFTSFKIRYMQGRDTRPRTFNQIINGTSETESIEAGLDATGGDILSELTLQLGMPNANAVIMGVCEAACAPCPTLPTTYTATLGISAPCENGPVEGGTTVTLTLTGTKPNQAYNIATPTGIITITAGAQGSGSATYILPEYNPTITANMSKYYGHPGTNLHTFAIVTSETLTNVSISGAAVTACVKDPCDVREAPAQDPDCPTVCEE